MGYAEVTKHDYDLLGSAGEQGIVQESHALSSSDASVIRTKLNAISTNTVIPVTASIIPPLMNFISPSGSTFAVIKAVSGNFVKYIQSKAGTLQVNARVLSEVIAEGGHFDHIMRVATDEKGHRFLIDVMEYSVKIGNEERHYIPVACTYAVKIAYSEFRTDAASGNKIYKKVASNQWQVIDIEDSKVEDILWETSRDDDFLYLKENDPSSRMNEAYRISLDGGPLQHQRDGQWYTICSKTHAVS